MPAFVLPMLTEEQTKSVSDNARGMDFINSKSPALNPFCTRAEYPPMKLTPMSLATLSRVLAYFTGSPPLEATSMEMGVTEILLFTIGTLYFFSMLSPTFTRSFASL